MIKDIKDAEEQIPIRMQVSINAQSTGPTQQKNPADGRNTRSRGHFSDEWEPTLPLGDRRFWDEFYGVMVDIQGGNDEGCWQTDRILRSMKSIHLLTVSLPK